MSFRQRSGARLSSKSVPQVNRPACFSCTLRSSSFSHSGCASGRKTTHPPNQPTQLESLKWVYLVKVPYPTPRAQGLVAAPHSLRVPPPERRDGQVPHETAAVKKEVFHSTHENRSHDLARIGCFEASVQQATLLPASSLSDFYFFNFLKKLQTSARTGAFYIPRSTGKGGEV